MTSAIYQGTLWGASITPVEAIAGQPQKERLAYKLATFKAKCFKNFEIQENLF